MGYRLANRNGLPVNGNERRRIVWIDPIGLGRCLRREQPPGAIRANRFHGAHFAALPGDHFAPESFRERLEVIGLESARRVRVADADQRTGQSTAATLDAEGTARFRQKSVRRDTIAKREGRILRARPNQAAKEENLRSMTIEAGENIVADFVQERRNVEVVGLDRSIIGAGEGVDLLKDGSERTRLRLL